MITFQEESAVAIQDELNPLLKLHWKEIARNTDKIKLNVDWSAYKTVEDAGMLHTVTARADGVLIGYIVSMVAPNFHYCDWIMAHCDVLFMHPDYRGGSAFIKMLKFTEAALKKKDVVNFYVHMKLSHDFGSLLERYDYVAIERTFEKQL
jgi:hypothetical protein